MARSTAGSKAGSAAGRSRRDRSSPERAAERSRKRFARRQWRRRWLAWKHVVALLLVLVIAGVGIWAVYFSSWLSVQGVEVTGAETVSGAEIRTAAGVSEGKPLATVDLSAVRARVESLAVVKSADVTRKWPDHVLIEVQERTAIAVVEIGGTLRGMDATGVVFRSYRQAPAGLPRVQTQVGTSADALREAAEVVSALPDEVGRMVDHIDVETVDQITLVLGDGRSVVWGSSADSATKAKVLEALLQQGSHEKYDVSVPAQPTTSD